MKDKTYLEIMNFLKPRNKTPCRHVLKEIEEAFPSESSDSLISITLQWYTRVIQKENPHKLSRWSIYKEYKKRVKQAPDPLMCLPHSIEEMSVEHNLPPSMMAKFVLDKYVEEKNANTDTNNRVEAGRLFRNPHLIKDIRLSAEVRRCVLIDAAYGPLVSSLREMIGSEKEDLLKEKMDEKGFRYMCEDTLRNEGFDKTPDLRLSQPLVVDGQLIAWIESKALFACVESHKKYLNEQYNSYVNRYGPGLVIYWFGYVDYMAPEALAKGIVLKDCFPDIKKFDYEQAVRNMSISSDKEKVVQWGTIMGVFSWVFTSSISPPSQ